MGRFLLLIQQYKEQQVHIMSIGFIQFVHFRNLNKFLNRKVSENGDFSIFRNFTNVFWSMDFTELGFEQRCPFCYT